jgi:hypothetical protein
VSADRRCKQLDQGLGLALTDVRTTLLQRQAKVLGIQCMDKSMLFKCERTQRLIFIKFVCFESTREVLRS